LIAYETLSFCIDNRLKLLNHTTVFSTYFPPILKLYAWFPITHAKYVRVLDCVFLIA